MAFAFDPGDPVPAQFRRIATDQIEAAMAAIDAGENPEETVHDVRQRCKKLRGLLQLIRPRFKGWRRENKAIRDLAAVLSATRDNTVLAETLAGLLGEKSSRHPVMVALSKHIKAQGSGADYTSAIAECRGGMDQLHARAKDWSVKGDDFASLSEGFSDTYTRMKKAMKTARDTPTDENFHAWRKQAKYHLYQLSLLRRSAPDIVKGQSDIAKELADLLGKHHDLAVLTDVLKGEAFSTIAKTPTVIDEAGRRQDAQEVEAFALGLQLVAERPRAITRRYKTYWNSAPKET